MTTATDRQRPLLVAELFGPTFQGEGPSSGQQALFVRMSRCNLSCPGCDTPYTWDRTRFDLREHTRRHSAENVIGWCLGHSTQLVVITGGEPLLQQHRLLPVVEALIGAGRRVEVETNGTIRPTAELAELVSAFNVSPKLAGFAAPADARRRINTGALRILADTGRAVFKFVATGVGDLAEIAALREELNLDPVWVMPEGNSTEAVLALIRELADPVLERGWHLTGRLHVLLWEDARGR